MSRQYVRIHPMWIKVGAAMISFLFTVGVTLAGLNSYVENKYATKETTNIQIQAVKENVSQQLEKMSSDIDYIKRKTDRILERVNR